MVHVTLSVLEGLERGRIYDGLTAPVTIGRDCWLGSKSTVLRGSTIGDGAVIGAHALVRGKIPKNAIAVGIPARVVKMRTSA